MSATLMPSGQTAAASRPDRAPFIGFVRDHDTEHAIRRGLSDVLGDSPDMRRSDIRGAIAALERIATPLVILVDISGEENPLVALTELSEVVEPDVRVLVVGDRSDINFYRQITRNLGVVDYLYKPLTAEVIARNFSAAFGSHALSRGSLGGRLVTITGAGGGVGATTIATNLAWYVANTARRYALLMDPDVHTGSTATLLGTSAGSGLRTILEAPHRVDELFITRSVQPMGNRLFLLSGDEPLTDPVTPGEGAVENLLACVSRRYNFVFADVPIKLGHTCTEILNHAQQRVIVCEPSITSMKDVLRLLALPRGDDQAQQPLLILNRANQPGGLSVDQVETALGRRPDISVPYLPRHVGSAANSGEMAITKSDALLKSITAIAREVGCSPMGSVTRGNKFLAPLMQWLGRRT